MVQSSNQREWTEIQLKGKCQKMHVYLNYCWRCLGLSWKISVFFFVFFCWQSTKDKNIFQFKTSTPGIISQLFLYLNRGAELEGFRGFSVSQHSAEHPVSPFTNWAFWSHSFFHCWFSCCSSVSLKLQHAQSLFFSSVIIFSKVFLTCSSSTFSLTLFLLPAEDGNHRSPAVQGRLGCGR